MADSRTTAPAVTLEGLIVSWGRSLRAENKSPLPIRAYTDQARSFARFAGERGMPADVTAIRREHVETYIEDVLSRWKPSTALTHYRSLQQFFKWLADEGEITETPMARMRPPKLDETHVPVIRDEDQRALLSVCAGRAFEDRRDTAIIRLFMNTGARLAEIAGLNLENIDLDHGEALVRRKGGREQVLPLVPKTIKALDRYLRVRPGHRCAALPDLWLGGLVR